MRRPSWRAAAAALAAAAVGIGTSASPGARISAADSLPPGALTLWYRQPAAEWVEALPVGNGRLGAMVFGGTASERIQLNEDTVWSRAGTRPRIPASIAEQLPEIRRLFFDLRYREGEARAAKAMLVVPDAGGSYQTLGELTLDSTVHGEAVDYRRSLDLDSGIALTTYTVNGVRYRVQSRPTVGPGDWTDLGAAWRNIAVMGVRISRKESGPPRKRAGISACRSRNGGRFSPSETS